MTSQSNILFLKWSSSLHSTKKAKWRNTICQPKRWHQSKTRSIYCATSQFPCFHLYLGSNYLRRGHGCEPDTLPRSLKNCKWLCKLVDLDLGVSCWNREVCFTANDLKFVMPHVLRLNKKRGGGVCMHGILLFLGKKTENSNNGDNTPWKVAILWNVLCTIEDKIVWKKIVETV